MTIAPGTSLGSFETICLLGIGGMGEVYRANDTRLGREVAIKILPKAFEEHPDRLARFEREARLLASLNHPNIAGIYGLEEADGRSFLVLEMVPGQTLEQVIAKGPLDVKRALGLMEQIAEGLEAAHQQGIIHRDLKPANIKVTPEGKIKILDFGLAKAFEVDADNGVSTGTLPVEKSLTAEGAIIGTPAYMSPEQARGQAVDKRADIWAFGCIFYELLTARRSFAGATPQDTLAAILERAPEWEALPKEIPPNMHALLRRCLHKHPYRRLQDIGDARIEIEDALNESSSVWATPSQAEGEDRRRNDRVIVGVLAGVLIGAIVAAIGVPHFRAVQVPEKPAPSPMRFVVQHPTDLRPIQVAMPAISRDGKRLAYVGMPWGDTYLYVRNMGDLSAREIPGVRGASSPFFSPRGDWVGYFLFGQGKMKKISMKGGRPVTVADCEIPVGAAWGEDDFIYFTQKNGGGITRVAASGGAVETLTVPNRDAQEGIHFLPSLLPNDRGILFTITLENLNNPNSAVAYREGNEYKVRMLIEGGGLPQYVSTGHLIFFRGTALYAVKFDLETLEISGPERLMQENIGLNPYVSFIFDLPQFSVSETGTLVYVPHVPANRSLIWVDRNNPEPELLTPKRQPYRLPRFSPDGSKLAVTVDGAGGGNIWIYDRERENFSRFTFEGSNAGAVWTPDARRIAFFSAREGLPDIYWKPADSSAGAERLAYSENIQIPDSWHPDGNILSFTELSPVTDGDVWTLQMNATEGPAAEPYLVSQFDESKMKFHPGGKWVVYETNESGQMEIYVRPYPPPGGKIQISTDGGHDPMWSPTGTELFYMEGRERMMAVQIGLEGGFEASIPEAIFEGDYLCCDIGQSFDVTPDGQKFLMIEDEKDQVEVTQLNVVVNWFEELKAREQQQASR